MTPKVSVTVLFGILVASNRRAGLHIS